MIDRQARGLSPGTVAFYRQKLGLLQRHLDSQAVVAVEDITPRILRVFFVTLSETHTPGGVHAIYRAVRAFLNWWQTETDPSDWSNPIRKLHPPRVPEQILSPIPLEDLRAMLKTCERRTFAGDRDRALLLCLLDSGCRRAEFCALNIGDVNLASGRALVRHGKGHRPRAVFLGAKSRRALVAYLNGESIDKLYAAKTDPFEVGGEA